MNKHPFKTAYSILHKKDKSELWACSLLIEINQTDVHLVARVAHHQLQGLMELQCCYSPPHAINNIFSNIQTIDISSL